MWNHKKQIERLTKSANSLGKTLEKTEEIRAQVTGLELLLKAKTYFEKNNINIWIEAKGKPPPVSFGIDRWARAGLLDLLNWIIDEVSSKGIR